MWTVVYISTNQKEAAWIQKMLTKEGILVKLRGIGPPNPANHSVEILVPESEVDEALEIINSR
ncbi:MAG: glutamate decarboxylase [Bacillota bacterium]